MGSTGPQKSLEGWLVDLERRNPRQIELGLDRVNQVWRSLGGPCPARRVIVVGGTNGKGSTVAFIESAARASGWRVATYTSPHICRYNERIRIEGHEADDAAIVRAFEQIEVMRDGVPLTYFEFGTLAALLLMAESSPVLDLAILEVGLGGRLDAVNIVDADVAVVTTVALDHQAWLGDTRDAIGREKAGVARPLRPFVVGERDAEPALLHAACERGALICRLGMDFDIVHDGHGTSWFTFRGHSSIELAKSLPLPGPVQWDNAATALAALVSLADVNDVPLDLRAAAVGLLRTRLPGRLECLSERPEIVIDVGHNPQAARALAGWLQGEGAGSATDAVFSALADKDIPGIVEPLLPFVRFWHVCGLADVSPRGLEVATLAKRLADTIPVNRMRWHDTVSDALASASAALGADERLLAFGSFHVVEQARKWARAGL